MEKYRDKNKPAIKSGLDHYGVFGFFGKFIPKMKFVYICDVHGKISQRQAKP